MDTIQREITRLANIVSGTVGVYALHMETGQATGIQADVRFPMASTFKVPIAVRVLSLVDQGQLALGQLIEVRPSDLCPGSGMIQSILYQPGLVLSVQNLLELMLVISDNTACDVLLRVAGGPQAVTDFLHAQGIEGVRVDRYTKTMVADKFGISGLPAGDDWTLGRFRQVYDQLTPEEKTAAAQRFAADERDTTTPAAMVRLLAAVYAGDILVPGSRDVLLNIMQRCQTGEGALKGMLTPDIVVAHKTGTMGEVVANDVGMITLPFDAGHIAIAVCIQSREAVGEASSACQKTIAHIARAAFDYFLFH
ncbi:MAG TPA: class A beta-lactamase [Anaerolineales bacterium]